RCARRGPGPPLTSPSRSGKKAMSGGRASAASRSAGLPSRRGRRSPARAADHARRRWRRPASTTATERASSASDAITSRWRRARLADSRRRGGGGQVAYGERQAERRVSLREVADAPGGHQEVRLRQSHLVLERLRDQLSPARERALDEPRRERDRAEAADDL